MGRRKNDRRARNTGGLRQKGNNIFEGRLRVRRKDGSFIEKSFTRNTKTECQEIINSLRMYEPLENNVVQIKIDRYTNAITLIKEGQDNNINSNILFGEYLDYFVMTHRKKGMKNTQIKENTIRSYIDKLKLIKDKIGNRKMAELKFADIEKALQQIHNETCDGTAKKVKNLVQSAFKFALKDGVVSVNILADEDIHFREQKGKSEKKIIEKEDEDKVIKYCLENKRYEILMIFYTGIRNSECCGLTWNNIDFNNCTVSIEKEYMKVPVYEYVNGKLVKNGYKTDFTDLKSKSSYRKLGIPSSFCEILKIHKENQKELAKKCNIEFSESDWVFTTKSYRGYINKDIGDNFRCMKENLKIKNYKELTVHSIRHTFCTRGLRNKVSLKEMQGLLGHENIAITADWYAHLNTEEIINASNMVNQGIESQLNEYVKSYEK